MFYHDILLFLHLVGLAVGLGIGTANIFLVRWAAQTEKVEEATLLRSLPPRLAQISQIGLAVLVITGLLLLFTVGGMASYSFGQFWFYMKLLAVGAMIVVVYFLFQAQRAIREGRTPQFGEYLPIAGPAIGGLALLATLFAVFVY
jgi:uncharacterized membrane protein SirB2